MSQDKKSGPVNWDEVHRKVNAMTVNLEKGGALSPEEKRALLKTRAQSLAKEKGKAAAEGETLEVLLFRLAAETYALETKFIREVYPLKDFTPLPGTPSFLLGLVNVRGGILSVIDLKKFFSLPEKGLGELNKIIIIQSEKLEFGILADEVTGNVRIALDGLQKNLATVSGIGAEYLKGITKERMIVLDAEKILSDPKIIVRQEQK